ncbi:MAG: sulfotransferase domain-containing protein [Planctomycetia bacterium]|nr:sulfotransferase domain-containing protein [Planctomycetia bacterium]
MTPPPSGTIIASFPKAGSTWVRFIIANLYNVLAPEAEAVDFHNIHEIVPELGRPDGRRLFVGMPAVWKTHDEWRKGFDRVVLVVRNPWDTLSSFHHYMNGEWGKPATLESVITSRRHGAKAVVHHAASYFTRCPDLLVLTYEALHASPRAEVARLAGFLGLEPTVDQLLAAIDASSFDSMRTSEAEKGRKYGGSGFRFMRQGAVGAGFAAISAAPALDRHVRRELAKCPPLHELYGEFHA